MMEAEIFRDEKFLICKKMKEKDMAEDRGRVGKLMASVCLKMKR